MSNALSRWVRFTLNHPWLSAAIVAAAAGGFLALMEPALGIAIGVIGFIVVGMGQSSQTRRATEEEKALGKVEQRRGPIGRWMVAHPWLSGAIGGLMVAVGEMARELSRGATFGLALIFSLALGSVFFIGGGLLMTAARRRDKSLKP